MLQRSNLGQIDPAPVADLTYRLRRLVSISIAVNLDVAAGAFVGVRVPAGERWRLIHVTKPVTTSASRVFIQIRGSSLYATASATAEQIWFAYTEMWLQPGDGIGLVTTDDLGDADRTFFATYETVPENDHR